MIRSANARLAVRTTRGHGARVFAIIRRLAGTPAFADLCAPVDRATEPALDRADAGDPALTEDQRQWVREGVVIRRGFFPDDVTAPYIAVREKLGEYGLPALLGGWQNSAPYLHIPELRALSLHPPLMALLESLLGEPAMLVMNLTNWMTSDRNWHQDAYLNPPFVGAWYFAIWIALDRIAPDAGPFEYVPGSHRWPALARDKVRGLLPRGRRDLRSGTDAEIWPTLTQDRLARVVEREIARRKATVVPFFGERGDLLVWHARLLHRGSPARRRGAERRSLIAHYSAAGRRPDILSMRDPNGQSYAFFDQPLVWARAVDGGIEMERRDLPADARPG